MNQMSFEHWTRSELESAHEGVLKAASPEMDRNGYWVAALRVLIRKEIKQLERDMCEMSVLTEENRALRYEMKGKREVLQRFLKDDMEIGTKLESEIRKTRPYETRDT